MPPLEAKKTIKSSVVNCLKTVNHPVAPRATLNFAFVDYTAKKPFVC